ncbi:DMT family transporter [Allonocardiopsis opalescens]|uniref:Magnesium transporter NIPA n=1 Tax=Allonocardiopsis opalescens TaxID=1144618 RepID=A0A2T0PXQ1_9ACTN|nr:DMT family transporter [Allonocardiopsis opalescens]PRX96302.1 magnesium transporter NIPA [Allonocardiopsis opalescens]
MTLLAIALAVVGAGGCALGAYLQHGAVTRESGGGTLAAGGMLRLLRTPRWLAGLVMFGAGTGLHVIAVLFAPLTVVQPVGVLALAITAALAARAAGARLRPGQIGAIAACMAGVGLFVTIAAGGAHGAAFAPGVEWRAGLLVAAGVLLGGATATIGRGRLRCLGYTVAAGSAFGYVPVLLKVTAFHLAAEGLSVATLLPAGAIVLAALSGGWFIQQAYASGPPDVVVAGLTVADPIVAVGVGLLFLGEGAALDPASALALLAAAGLAVAGVAALARQRSATLPPGSDPGAPAERPAPPEPAARPARELALSGGPAGRT